MPLFLIEQFCGIIKIYEFERSVYMRIIVDAFGGDNAPLEILKGC